MTPLLSGLVYTLCFLTSAACAGLLVRQYALVRSAILLWSAACFVLLALSNLVVVVDLVLLPTEVSLRLYRLVLTLIAVSVLLFGFIWEAEGE